jgi:hypothetical protein
VTTGSKMPQKSRLGILGIFVGSDSRCSQFQAGNCEHLDWSNCPKRQDAQKSLCGVLSILK